MTLATERRARQLADTGLAAYTATAHGYLTFLAQLGEGFPDPPKVVKADELGLEVYWRAPNYSKQVIVGRRDTLVLPTDIQYHRDHLGIVQNNFPAIIRLGEGDEVRDVPHPLSAAGMAAYEFAISDSLRIGIPGRTIDVYEVKVRPRDDRSAAVVGAVYLARDDAQVVRMAFSFTRAALLDRELEDVSIVLENSLIEGRFWLPRRQEIEIRRTGSWLDFPARGIIRGRWEICCYVMNQAPPVAFFAGPEIVTAPVERRRSYPFKGAILDSLPADVRVATDQDVRRVQDEARALMSQAALARAKQTRLAVPRLSDVIRFSRAEGLSLGAGLRRTLGGGFAGAAALRFGLGDHEAKGSIETGWQMGANSDWSLRIYREYREASDVAEASALRNSLGAQEFGSDYTDPFDARGGTLTFERHSTAGGRWRLTAGYEWVDSVRIAARPTFGRFERILPVAEWRGPIVEASYQRTGLRLPGSFRGDLLATVRTGRQLGGSGRGTDYTRTFAMLGLARSVGRQRLVLQSFGGALWGSGPLPAQEYLLAGGPVTAPGFSFHQFAATRILGARAEWVVPVPFPAIPLGRWGRIPGQGSIVPLGSILYVGKPASYQRGAGWYPSVGAGALMLFDLLRIDVARGLRDGRWTFNADISRDFWRIL